MGNKRVTQRKEQQFDLALTHTDFVSLMNDPQANVYDGTVDENQEFEILIRKSNGSEIMLKTLSVNDTLLVRFTKVEVTNVDAEFNNIDII